MIQITPAQTATLKNWFVPDRPGPLVGLHLLLTGNGACFVDRWPNPRAILVDSAGNYSLLGDPAVLKNDDLKYRISGFVEAPERFASLLRATFSEVRVWERVIFDLPSKPHFSPLRDQLIRRLEPADSYHLWGLSSQTAWVCKTWGGPAELAASGYAWGAFVAGRLASVACTFFVGERYEDIGVATEPEFRGLGLSTVCAGALCEDIQRRGRQPSWSTAPDNRASIRVAEKLGFLMQRHDHVYVIGVPIPEAAQPEAA